MTLRLALIADCDGTLAQDTTSLLVREIGMEPSAFWKEVDAAVADGWDPPLAWTVRLLREAQTRQVGIDHSFLERTAAKIVFHPGALALKGVLEDHIRKLAIELGADLQLEFHVITSGSEDLLACSALRTGLSEVWGSLLEFDSSTGLALGPKSTVSFTEKTKFVFAINKGISKQQLRADPKRVNDPVPRGARPVPFRNMIYIGDGPTDIPCYSLIEQSGGAAIGVRKADGADHQLVGERPILWNYRPRWGPFHPDFGAASDVTMLLKDLLADAAARAVGPPA